MFRVVLGWRLLWLGSHLEATNAPWVMPMMSHKSFFVICEPFDTWYSLHWRAPQPLMEGDHAVVYADHLERTQLGHDFLELGKVGDIARLLLFYEHLNIVLSSLRVGYLWAIFSMSACEGWFW